MALIISQHGSCVLRCWLFTIPIAILLQFISTSILTSANFTDAQTNSLSESQAAEIQTSGLISGSKVNLFAYLYKYFEVFTFYCFMIFDWLICKPSYKKLVSQTVFILLFTDWRDGHGSCSCRCLLRLQLDSHSLYRNHIRIILVLLLPRVQQIYSFRKSKQWSRLKFCFLIDFMCKDS